MIPQLNKETKDGTLPEKIAVYQHANKEVVVASFFVYSLNMIEKKLAQVDAKIEKMELDKKIKEDLKTVALGTSKINYLDPRISVAWCKRHEVPIEKVHHLLLYISENSLAHS
ncbi:hypothetical protein BHE74_00009216, partial [Ensete ventricosum]